MYKKLEEYPLIELSTSLEELVPELRFNRGIVAYFQKFTCWEIDFKNITFGDLIHQNIQYIIDCGDIDSHSKLVLIYLVYKHGFRFRHDDFYVENKKGKKIWVSIDTDLELLSFLLPERINNILKREGLIKVSDLLSKYKEDLSEIPGLGRHSLKEIELFLGLFRCELITREEVKNSLLAKLQKLQAKRQDLSKREQALDQQIEKVLQEISEFDKKDKQKVK